MAVGDGYGNASNRQRATTESVFLDARQDPLVMVTAFRTPEQAHLARMLLQAYGIECALADQFTIGVNLYFSHAVGGVKVLVHRSEFAEAVEILEASYPQSHKRSTIACPNCGSPEITFGRFKLLSVIFVVLAIDLPPPLAFKRTCTSCGHRWDTESKGR